MKLSMGAREGIQGWLFASPWVVGFLFFSAEPMLAPSFLGLAKWDITALWRFVGLSNFVTMPMADPQFWNSVRVTVVYWAVTIPAGLVLGLVVALMMNQKVRGIAPLRTVYYLPNVVPAVTAGMLWAWIFNSDFGILNYLLWHFLHIHGPGWLASEQRALPALMLMSLWTVGGGMVIYLAGLQGVPRRLYEAAEIDGAGLRAKSRHATAAPAPSPGHGQAAGSPGRTCTTLLQQSLEFREGNEAMRGHCASTPWTVGLAALVLAAALLSVVAGQPIAAAAESAPQVAVVMSANSGNFYGPGYNQSISQLRGMLDEAGVAYKMVFNRGVEEGALVGYRLVILPLDACLSSKEVEQIRAYVRGGGKILAAYEVGNHTETGAATPDFQIGDLLGVRLLGWNAGAPKYGYIHFKDSADPLAKRLPDFVPAPRHTTLLVEPLAGSRVAAEWYNDDKATPSDAAAVVATDHSVYFADNIFDPTVAPDPAIRRMVLNAIKVLAPGVVDVEKGAKASLQALDERLAAVTQALGDSRYLDIPDAVIARAQQSLDAVKQRRAEAQSLAAEGMFDDAQAVAQDAALQAASIPNDLIESNPVELRALWVDRNSVPKSPAAIADMMDRIQRDGFNTVFVEVFSGGYTLWPSQVAASYGIVKQAPGYEQFDPLQVLVDEAHKRGIALIAWFWGFCAGANEQGPILSKYPQWQELMQGGNLRDQFNFAWISPAVPEARAYLLKLYAEVVRKYAVDGIQLDYIRYSETPSGYSQASLQRFQKETGLDASTLVAEKDPQGWLKWIQWRANLVTTFVSEVASEVRALRPGISVSADVGPGYKPEGDYPGALQDWPTWVERGYLDFVVPMVYRNTPKDMRSTLDLMKGYLSIPALVYPGLQAWQIPQPSDLISQITEARKDSLGVAVFALPYMRPDIEQALRDGAFRTPAVVPHEDPLHAAGLLLASTGHLLDLYRSRGLVQGDILNALADRLQAIKSRLEPGNPGTAGTAPAAAGAVSAGASGEPAPEARLAQLGQGSEALVQLGAVQQLLEDWQAAGRLDPRAVARIGRDLSQARLLVTMALR